MTTPRTPSPKPSEDWRTTARPSVSSLSRSRTPSPGPGRGNGPAPRSPPSYDTVELRKPPSATRDPDRDDRGPPLEYRWLPVVLAVVYLVTLIVPWVLICILDHRPFTAPSYHDQRGRMDAGGIQRAMIFANVFRAISAVIVIPITSLILSHAVVAYSQRHSHEKKLNMRQLFALADRGWANAVILWRAFRGPSSSVLLWVGAGLLVLGGIQQPLQSALVSTVPIAATTWADLPFGPFRSRAITVGYDAEPWAISLVDQKLVVEDVATSLVTISDDSDQENIWLDTPHFADEDVEYRAYDDPIGQTMLRWYRADPLKPDRMDHPGSSFFVSTLANGTTTGVLREHAIRLNSSISCERISRADYPSSCPGARPLSADIETSRVGLRACAPGDLGVSPWTRSRNRQDIDEELYLDFTFNDNDPRFTINVDNFTMHCTASTSRGYFELGNVMNDGRYGPLMDKWPDPETIETETNNWLPVLSTQDRPTETDETEKDLDDMTSEKVLDPFDLRDTPAPGPLMTSANALFGNYSFLQIVRDSPGLTAVQAQAVLCQYGRRVPFTQVWQMSSAPNDKHVINCQNSAEVDDDDDEDDGEMDLDEIVASWMYLFSEEDDAEFLLLVSTFLANRAVLDMAIQRTSTMSGLAIYSSPGTPFSKPSMHVASMAVISALILLQAAGMGALVWYINRTRTWTGSLDAMAMARIGKAMGDDKLPPIGPVTDKDRAKLEGVDALVGIAEGGTRDRDVAPAGGDLTVRGQIGIPPAEEDRGTATDVKFGLGAKGLITRDAISKSGLYQPMRRKPRTWDYV